MSFFAHPLFVQLSQLHLPVADFAVFGSGPMWVRGIRTSDDIDLIARGDAWNRLKQIGVIHIAKNSGREVVHLADGKIEAFDGWYPGDWNIDALIDSADKIQGIPFVKLSYVLEWKQRLKREKDLRDIELINAFMSSTSL